MNALLKSIRKSVNWSSRRRCSTLRMSWRRLTWAWNWAGRLMDLPAYGRPHFQEEDTSRLCVVHEIDARVVRR
ncbi:MAG: hypothetical protein HGB05_20760 [Chloroflexi bacterium]|nr:hypothetical protein [Chloroflexota bacterium]